MSSSSLPRRDRAPIARAALGPQPFDGYPYLISRIGKCPLRHIALLPAEWTRDRIIDAALAQASANRLETAACLGPDDAEFVDADAVRTWPGPTPTGAYVIDRLLLPEPLPMSNELVVRRAAFTMYDAAHRHGGFLVGDGTDHGRGAVAATRARLGGRRADGLPTGLQRCARCGEAAGDYLRGGTEIVRIYCACENHNRCARCLGPLADHRLSAWFWDDRADSAWHLSAYAAFSHRCPSAG